MKLVVFAHTPSAETTARATRCSCCWKIRRRLRKQKNIAPKPLRHRVLPRQSALFRTLEEHRRASSRKSTADFVLLRGRRWCRSVTAWKMFLLPAPASQSRLPRLAGMLVAARFFKKINPALARRRAAKWMKPIGSIRTRSLTYRMKCARLGIVLWNSTGATRKNSWRKNAVVSGGHSRPLPAVAEKILPLRRARIGAEKIRRGNFGPAHDPAKTVKSFTVRRSSPARRACRRDWKASRWPMKNRRCNSG